MLLLEGNVSVADFQQYASADPDIFLRGGGGGGGGSHRKRTRLIIRYFDFRISMDVSLLQEKSTFPVLTMRMSPHLEPFFFFFNL